MGRPLRFSFFVASTMSAASALALSAGTAGSGDLSLVVRVDNGGASFHGDGPALVTVSPNGDGHRETAFIHFRVSTQARVTVDLARHGARAQAVVASRSV